MPEGQIDYTNLNQPEPMGGQKLPVRNVSGQKPGQPLSPAGRPIVPFLLMIFLALVLVSGILVFFSWKGWLKIGFLSGAPTPSSSPAVSPSVSPSPSPTAEASPETMGNVNDGTRKTDLETIQKALKQYFIDKNSYPVSGTMVKTSDSGSPLAQALVPNYLQELPDDPLSPKNYYGYKSDGQSFELTCVLEDKTDSAGSQIGNNYIYKVTNITN